nr:hypothetical protein [Saprospiraceae bacterium]
MQSKIIKLLLALSSALLLLVVLAFLYLHFQRDHIKTSISNAINDQIETRFTYSDFELSLISQFPFVRARLKEVYLAGNDRMPFIYCKNVDLKMDLRSILRKEYELKSLLLSGGSIYIIEREDDTFNYNIFTPKESEGGNDLNILFRNLELHDMEVIVDLQRSKQTYKTYLPQLMVNGTIISNELYLQLEGSLLADYLNISGHHFLENKELFLQCDLLYDLDQHLLQIADLQWESDGAKGSAQGEVQTRDDIYSLSGELFPTSLFALKSMLPKSIRENEMVQNTDGVAGALFSVQKPKTNDAGPQVTIDLKLDKGVMIADRKTSISNMKGEFHFAHHPLRPGLFKITYLTGEVDGSPLSVRGQLLDWGKNSFDLTINGLLPLIQLDRVTDSDESLELKSGYLQLNNLKVAGSMDEAHQLKTFDLDGKFELKDCDLIWRQEPIFLSSGGGNFIPGENIAVNNLKFKAFNSEGTLTVFGPEVAYFLAKNPGKSEDKTLDLNIAGKQVDLRAIMDFLNRTPDEPHSAESEKSSFTLPITHIQVNTERLLWKNALVEEFNGMVSINDQGGIVTGAGTHATGKMELDGHFSLQGNPSLSFRLSARDMAIDQVLLQWDQFDQDFIHSKHIEGRLQGHVWGNLLWDSNGDLDTRHAEIVAAFEFRDGILKEFPLLQDFSTYVNEQDLKRIKFSKVSNIIWMRDGTVYLPGMFIQSNAMNLSVAGAHTLDQHIMYGIQLNAGQVLAERIRGHNSNMKPIPARKRGFFNMHYLLTGHTSDFSYQTSASGVNSLFNQTAEMKKRAMEKLNTSFITLPYFSGQWSEEEVLPPEYPLWSEEDETPEYLPGFQF